jgi:hypothetical protein
MRSKIGVASILLVAGLLIFGCSSDDKSTATGPSPQEQFDLIKPNLDIMIEDMMDGFVGGVDKFTDWDTTSFQAPGLGRVPARADTDTIATYSYVYQNGWHIRQASIVLPQLILNASDSTKFTNEGGQTELIPSELTTNDVYSIAHVSLNVTTDNGSLITVIYTNFELTGFQLSTITIDGESYLDLYAGATTAHGLSSADLEASIDLSSVTIPRESIDEENVCPTGGSATFDLEGEVIDYDTEGNRFTFYVDATVTVTFSSGGDPGVVVTIGSSQFTYTYDGC